MKDRIKTEDEIREIAKVYKLNGKRVVTTNGAFDIFHYGHLYSLKLAKTYGDILIVCLNSDASVRQYKSADRPIIGEQDRAYLLAGLECVDYVTLFDETDPRRILSVIKPNVHVKSRSGFKGIEREVVESNGGRIVLLDDLEGHSTTEIIERIRNANK